MESYIHIVSDCLTIAEYTVSVNSKEELVTMARELVHSPEIEAKAWQLRSPYRPCWPMHICADAYYWTKGAKYAEQILDIK